MDALQALDWGKGDGLLPAVVQDADTLQVLMLGYVSAESLAATLAIGHMTFFSRSKQRLWTKGERSGNVLVVQSISVDCDADTLLVMARPAGPTCHTGAESCFDQAPKDFLGGLGQLVAMREAQSISVDCDADTLLVMARPAGPTCHTGAESCFD
ncbi:phosphoribosyl-AMP cyclohydrolase, partial [Stenotrophomonas maltophilia]